MKNGIAKSLVLIIFFTIIFSCSESKEAEALTLSAGDYKGTWNSSTATATFNNLAISALRSVSGNLKVPFISATISRPAVVVAMMVPLSLR